MQLNLLRVFMTVNIWYRNFFLCLLLFIFCIFFFQCANKKSNSNGRSVFRYNESNGITSLDPAFAKDQANIWATNQIFNGLVQLDDSLNVKPSIAKSWEISNNGKVYKFYLRQDVFFHNHFLFKDGKGRRVVANDFVYSFNRLLNESVASPGSWIMNNVNRNIKNSFEAINDTTFIINLKNSFPPFLGLLSMQYCSVVPKEIAEYYGKEFRSNPIGTGPFCFKYWKEGVKMVLVKNNNYFEYEGNNRLPYLDAIAISFIVDKQTAFLEFVKGKFDFMSGIDPNYKDELLTLSGRLNPKYADKFNMSTMAYLNTEYLGFLLDSTFKIYQNSPIKLQKIRKAINYGFDRKKMMMYLRNNIGFAASSGIVPMGMPSFDSTIVRGYNYNPDLARALLAEAGFPNGKGLSEIQLSTTSSYLDLCKYIQHELSEIGIKIKIEVNPGPTLREMIAKSGVVFFRGSWIADYPDAENYLSLFYSKNFAPKGPNYTHFSNLYYDRLYENSQLETNDSLRFLLYQKMDSIIISEAAIVPLYYDQLVRFYQKNILNLGSNPLNLLNLKRVKKM